MRVLLALFAFVTACFALTIPAGIHDLHYTGGGNLRYTATVDVSSYDPNTALRLAFEVAPIANGKRPAVMDVKVSLGEDDIPSTADNVSHYEVTYNNISTFTDKVDITVTLQLVSTGNNVPDNTRVASIAVLPGVQLLGGYPYYLPSTMEAGSNKQFRYWTAACDAAPAVFTVSDATLNLAVYNQAGVDMTADHPEYFNEDKTVFTVPAPEAGAAAHTIYFASVVLPEGMKPADATVVVDTAGEAMVAQLNKTVEFNMPSSPGCVNRFTYTVEAEHEPNTIHIVTIDDQPASDVSVRYALDNNTPHNWSTAFYVPVSETTTVGTIVHGHLMLSNPRLPTAFAEDPEPFPVTFAISDTIHGVKPGDSANATVEAGTTFIFATDYTHVSIPENAAVNDIAQIRVFGKADATVCGQHFGLTTCTPSADTVISTVQLSDDVRAYEVAAPHLPTAAQWFYHVTAPEATPATVDIFPTTVISAPVANGLFARVETASIGGRSSVKFDVPALVAATGLEHVSLRILVKAALFSNPTDIAIYGTQKHVMPDAGFSEFSASGNSHATLTTGELDITKPFYVTIETQGHSNVEITSLVNDTTVEIEDGAAAVVKVNATTQYSGFFQLRTGTNDVLRHAEAAQCTAVITQVSETECKDCMLNLTIATKRDDINSEYSANTAVHLDLGIVANARLDRGVATSSDVFVTAMVTRIDGSAAPEGVEVTFDMRCGSFDYALLDSANTYFRQGVKMVAPATPSELDFALPAVAALKTTAGDFDLKIELDVAQGKTGDIFFLACRQGLPVKAGADAPSCYSVMVPRQPGGTETLQQYIRIRDLDAVADATPLYVAAYAMQGGWQTYCEAGDCVYPTASFTITAAEHIRVNEAQLPAALVKADEGLTYVLSFTDHMFHRPTKTNVTVKTDIHATTDGVVTICMKEGADSLTEDNNTNCKTVDVQANHNLTEVTFSDYDESKVYSLKYTTDHPIVVKPAAEAATPFAENTPFTFRAGTPIHFAGFKPSANYTLFATLVNADGVNLGLDALNYEIAASLTKDTYQPADKLCKDNGVTTDDACVTGALALPMSGDNELLTVSIYSMPADTPSVRLIFTMVSLVKSANLDKSVMGTYNKGTTPAFWFTDADTVRITRCMTTTEVPAVVGLSSHTPTLGPDAAAVTAPDFVVATIGDKAVDVTAIDDGTVVFGVIQSDRTIDLEFIRDPAAYEKARPDMPITVAQAKDHHVTVTFPVGWNMQQARFTMHAKDTAANIQTVCGAKSGDNVAVITTANADGTTTGDINLGNDTNILTIIYATDLNSEVEYIMPFTFVPLPPGPEPPGPEPPGPQPHRPNHTVPIVIGVICGIIVVALIGGGVYWYFIIHKSQKPLYAVLDSDASDAPAPRRNHGNERRRLIDDDI